MKKLQISRKPKDKELANKENKKFDPGGKGGKPTLSKADDWYSFFGAGVGGMYRLGFPARFFCSCPSVSFCFYFFAAGKTR